MRQTCLERFKTYRGMLPQFQALKVQSRQGRVDTKRIGQNAALSQSRGELYKARKGRLRKEVRDVGFCSWPG